MNSSSSVVKGRRIQLGDSQIVQAAPAAPAAPDSLSPAPDEAAPPREDVLRLIQAEADAVVRDAQARAETLVADAHAESERIRQAAAAEGFAAGHAQGLEAAEAEARTRLEAVLQLAAGAAEAKARLIAQSEPTIVELAIAIAKKVIDAQVEINPKIVAQIAARAIEQVNGADRLVVRVNPRDEAVLREAWQEALSHSTGVRSFEVVADRRVGPGGCVIETPFGRVDAQIDTQLKNIRHTFQGTSEREQPAAQGHPPV